MFVFRFVWKFIAYNHREIYFGRFDLELGMYSFEASR